MRIRPGAANMNGMHGVYVGSFAHALGARKRHVRESAADGLLRSAPEDLEAAGFQWHRVCDPGETAYDLARSAVAEVAAGGGLDGVDAIVYATCLPDPVSTGPVQDVKELMDFPASRLQADFGLSQAIVVGLHQQACTGMLGALRVAAALLTTEPQWRRVLCVAADRFPAGAWYEQAYNLISDGAAACVVGRYADRITAPLRLLTVHQITNGGLARAGDDQTVGTYFAFTHRVVREALARAGLTAADLDWVVTQNTHEKAWQILARLLEVEHAKVWCPSLPDAGHVIAADVIVNLSALLASGRVRPGQRIAFVMAGFGLNWQCALLEVTR